MKRLFKTALCSSVALTALSMSVPAVAQETSSSIRGQVVDPSGSPVSGQSVVIMNTTTGLTRTVETSQNGTFSVRGLSVGGPYTVTVDSNSYTDAKVEGVFLTLGGAYTVNVALTNDNVEEIVVSAQSLEGASVAIGPNATYNLADLQTSPAINRDIKDIIRQDPRVYVDVNNSGAIQCNGANPRFNSLTVDGVGLNDNFGLNSNGYPTERVPFSFDAINQVAVEMAPFDVEYGQFTACNVNAVTKSGSNEFFGSAFFDYTSDGLQGSSLEGDSFDIGDFTEKRYGATLGGPIIEDKLFFFASYEKLEGAELFDRGAEGSGAAREIVGVTQDQLNRIFTASRDLYGFEPGELVSSLPVKDEKILLKLDWNINDSHRLAFTYNYNDGFSIAESDGDDNELEASNHYYERGARLHAYSGQLFSDWTDNFSTDLRVAYTDLDNRQNSLINAPIGEARIETSPNVYVYVGGDDSRQSNSMNYTVLATKLAGNYQLDDHSITFGYERLETEVFNLFVQHTNGEFRFDSVEDFEAGIPSRVYYGNAPSLNPDDAAGTFSYVANTLYLQDEYIMPDSGLTITAGLRYDWYQSDDLPNENANFIARNGYSNATNFDGESLLMPRLGFTWDYSDRIRFHGGIGIFSGGNPNVWLTNNYQQDGIAQIQVNVRDYDENFTLFDDPTANGGAPISDVPARLQESVTAGSANAGVNALDPDFKIPTQLKLALGAQVDFDAGSFGEDFLFTMDFLYSKTRNAATIIDTSIDQIGTAPDGRPVYLSVDRQNPDYPNCNPFSCNRWFNSDYILTNSEESGRSYVVAASLSKSYENGVDWTLGYAYTDSTDANPMGAAVAFSNYAGVSTSDPLNLTAATSNWEVPHRFTAKLSWAHDFWNDNTTYITLFGEYRQGRPFSFVFDDMGGAFAPGTEFGDGVDDRHLLYIPTGPDDPNVNFGDDFDYAAFAAFVDEYGLDKYAGGIAPRNGNYSDWWGKVDLRIEQEFPTFFEGHKISGFLEIENLTNLINDDWGVMYSGSYFGNSAMVAADLDLENNVYNFNSFLARDPQTRRTTPSLWKIRVGVKYKF